MERARLILAWVLIAASIVGWPLTLWLTDEPPFVLSLSWLAITLTAWDILNTTHVRNQQEDESGSG